MQRPLEPLAEAVSQLGVKMVLERGTVIVEGGPPKGGNVRIRGDVSSQFISGLLLAGPLMENGLRLKLTSPLESRDYASLTMDIMKRHGIKVQSNNCMSLFEIAPGQIYNATAHRVPGDYSSAAFAMSAAAITGSKVLIRGLPLTKSEPDRVFVEILSQMGAGIDFSNDGVLVEGKGLKATKTSVQDCPDLGPVIAVLGCYAEGETQIMGAARLRYKESDRISAIASELRALGAEIVETDDGLTISGPAPLSGGVVHSHGDHRVAMALSVAALGAWGNVIIRDAECVSKSYPNFFDDLRSLGVEVVGR
jgi:3-phosphoshikimate 1-carboxyvinyltransferase